MENDTFGFESIKVFVSTVIASGISIFGVSFKYILVLAFLMIIDTAFGWTKSIKQGEWKISTAKNGFIGKIIELTFIGVLYVLDWIFEIDMLKYMGVFYFGICEIASIIDNYSAINGNLPDGISYILNRVRKGVGVYIIKKIKSITEKFFDDYDKK